MIGSSLTAISRRTSRQCSAGLTATQISRSMVSNSKKNRKQAMHRQRKLNPATEASSKSSQSETQSDGYFSSTAASSSLSGNRIISDPISPATGSFDQMAGLSKLQLRPSLDDYLEKYDLNESYENHAAGKGAPTWESNKSVIPPPSVLSPAGGSATSGLLLRNSSTLATGKTNRNVLTDQDDGGFLIDRDSMFDPSIHLPHAPKDWKGYEPATPLSEFLMQRIGVSGQPISTAEYMRHALTHPLYGYYTSKEKMENDEIEDDWDDDEYDIDGSKNQIAEQSTIFGRGGDFVTAPELSSVFGHSLCVWFMTVWQQEPLGKPKDIQFVELGPGKGTLMADVLELAHSSKLMNFGQSIRTVHFVEASRELRRKQQETLQKAVGHLVKLEFVNGESVLEEASDDNEEENASFVNTIRIEWHDTFSNFQASRDKSVPTMVLMQEFLDALPVHQFQKTEDGWRERMIDVVSADEPVPETGDEASEQLTPRLRQVLAPNVTPAVDLLLSSSHDQYDHFPEGTVIEICPDALFLVQDVAKVLEESQGAALIIDYGEEGTADTLRAFSQHKQVPLTSRPGRVDVTADVDFFALKNCLSVDAFKKNKSRDDNEKTTIPSSIHAFGPVKQGEFLMKMGAGELTMSAIEKDETTEEQAQAFADALRYLVMPEHMGEKFKVLALSRKRDGLFGPAGIE